MSMACLLEREKVKKKLARGLSEANMLSRMFLRYPLWAIVFLALI